MVIRRQAWWAAGMLVAVLFWLSFTQFPLSSNHQTQYSLHGVALSPDNNLEDDALFIGVDPWPYFTRFVQFARDKNVVEVFSVVHVALAAAYILALVAIGRRAKLMQAKPASIALLAGFLILIQSEFIGDITRELLGRNVWMGAYLGVANQGLMGVLVVPSVFGVLILTSLAFFLEKRPYTAAVLIGLAGAMHFLHSVSSAMLVVAYCWLLWRERKGLGVILSVVGIWLILILPTAIYSLVGFAATTPEWSALGNHYLVSLRMPNHSDLSTWFGVVTILQLFFIGLGLWLVRKTRLVWLLGIPAAFALIGTIVFIISDNPLLAAVQPWRLSTYIVPACLAIVVATGVQKIRWPKVAPLVVFTLVLAAALYGAISMVHQWHAHGLAQQELKDLISGHSLPSGSTVVVPLDLKDWRLATETAAVVDFKTVPYRDIELIDWHDRYRLVQRLYSSEPDCNVLPVLAQRYSARYVVWRRLQPSVECSQLSPVEQTDQYALYEISRDGE